MKKVILESIDRAIRAEEESIPIYAKHLHNTMFWSALSDDKRKLVAETLLKLKEGSEKHKMILQAIGKIVIERYK